MPLFLKEFGELLALLQSFPIAAMIVGGFNIYVESNGDPSNQFHHLLSDKMLIQHVSFSTKLHHHMLDLIIAPEDLDIHVKRFTCLTGDLFANWGGGGGGGGGSRGECYSEKTNLPSYSDKTIYLFNNFKIEFTQVCETKRNQFIQIKNDVMLRSN